MMDEATERAAATHSQLVELQRDHQAVLSERDAALDCAQRLATVLWEKHYKDDAPRWTVGNDLVLVISQIDNMTAGMIREPRMTAAPDLLDACRVALGHMTGGMDGDWRDCDPVDLLRKAIDRAEGR